MRKYRNNLEDRYALVDTIATMEAHAIADEVDADINQVDGAALAAQPTPTVYAAIDKSITSYKRVRRLLRWIASWRTWPSTWRDALNDYFDSQDVIGLAVDPSFKAGKDV